MARTGHTGMTRAAWGYCRGMADSNKDSTDTDRPDAPTGETIGADAGNTTEKDPAD